MNLWISKDRLNPSPFIISFFGSAHVKIHVRAAKVQASMRIRAVSPDSGDIEEASDKEPDPLGS